jgi:hypothetical protein
MKKLRRAGVALLVLVLGAFGLHSCGLRKSNPTLAVMTTAGITQAALSELANGACHPNSSMAAFFIREPRIAFLTVTQPGVAPKTLEYRCGAHPQLVAQPAG